MTDQSLRSLREPRRNRYFYGKLMDVGNFQLEQDYGLGMRRMMNRLALGSGVLCGLGVVTGADGTLCVMSGVAIDGCGREIVVPSPRPSIDPAQPTDAQGRALGERLVGGQSTISLCYLECDADPTAVYVSECDGAVDQATSTKVERYCVIVTAGLPAGKPASLTPEQSAAIYPDVPPAGYDRRVATEQTLAITCPEPTDPCCVVLATVTLPEGDTPLAVDPYTYRAEVFSNTVLFELIAALADRVDACCAALHQEAIAITDGDAQQGDPGAPLAAPVHLLVTEGDGTPADGAEVVVATADPDAEVSIDGATFAPTVTATTAADGVVTVTWRLGSATGAQSFTATLPDGAGVTAHATAVEAATAPVVVRLEPANGSSPPADFRADPFVRVAFDQPMDPAGLADPDPWLRAWVFVTDDNGVVGDGRRLPLGPGKPGQGATSRFRAEPIDLDRFTVVVMMRGASPQIVSAGPQLALDADFAGTELTDDMLERLWESDGLAADPDFATRLRDTGAALPSGDGTAGGQFHAFFTVSPA